MAQNGIVGVWTLRSLSAENLGTGERSESFGADPSGILILHPDGRMAAVLTPRERATPVTDAEQAAAFQTMSAYSGRYRLEPPNRFVTTVDVAWLPSGVGTEQARTYALDGDRLDIVSAPVAMPGRAGTDIVVTLSWEREAGSSASST